jgi:hypothetical protein
MSNGFFHRGFPLPSFYFWQMWRRGIGVGMMALAWSGVFSQHGATNIFSYADGLQSAPGIWGTSGYTAALGKAETYGVGMFGEKLYGTELSRFELGIRARVGSQIFQFDVSRSGTSFFSFNRGSVSTGLKLNGALDLGVRLGFQYSSATGYASASFPFVGLGFGLRLSEKCRWMVQADDLNAFMKGSEGMRFRVRSGLSIQFSTICMLAVETMVTEGEMASLLASVHYRVTDDIFTRIGFVTGSSMFNLAAGFNRKGIQLEFFSGWQMTVGASAGLSVSCLIKTGKR